MSVFKVALNNTVQGTLDLNPTGADSSLNTLGSEFTTSSQRGIYVMGPNKINRLLKDGQTFTDCNYWKKFTYPTTTLDNAFLSIVSDDGSFWSDTNPSENVVPVVWHPGANSDGILVATKTYTDTNMALDIVATYGGPALFCEIQNADASHTCKVRINGSTNAIFTLATSTTQIFDSGDLTVTKLEFDNSVSGASNVNYVQVTIGVRPIVNS